MHRTPSLAFGCVLAAALPAQSRVVVPAACTTLPGNAAVSLPLRWSQGTMQVRIDAAQLPAALTGQAITGLRLRRPTFLFEPAYPAIQRTVTVRGGFQSELAGVMTSSLTQNRPAALAVLFGPGLVTVAATPAPGPSATIGQELLQIVFTQPLPVAAGSLFLEFETGDPPFQLATTNWVDAVWNLNGNETGYAVTVGDGSCTTRMEPTELWWDDTLGPRANATARFEVRGVPPSGIVLTWMGVDPQTQPPGPANLGFGASFAAVDAALAGCHQWAPFDVPWVGVADAQGKYETTFALAGPVAAGMRIGAQAAWFDESRPGIPLSFSNGLVMVLDNIAVGTTCSTVFFPAGTTTSPWLPFLGQMPVLILDY